MMTMKIAASLRAAIAGLALAFLIFPAAPLNGLVPVPNLGGHAFAGETCAGSHIRGSSFGNCGGGGTSEDDDDDDDDGDDPGYGPEDTADEWPPAPSCECGEALPNHWNKTWSCTPTNVCAIDDFLDDHTCPVLVTVGSALVPGGWPVRVGAAVIGGYGLSKVVCGG